VRCGKDVANMEGAVKGSAAVGVWEKGRNEINRRNRN